MAQLTDDCFAFGGPLLPLERTILVGRTAGGRGAAGGPSGRSEDAAGASAGCAVRHATHGPARGLSESRVASSRREASG